MYLKKIFSEWKIPVLFLFVILTLSFLIRTINLTKLPIFADEAIYIRWSQVMKSEPTLRFLPLSDGKQPLSMWLTMPLLKLVDDPLFAGRFLSVLTGTMSVLGVFFASFILTGDKKKSLLSAFILGLVPYGLFFDRMALADSTLTMFGIWVFAVGVWLSKNPRLDLAMILGFILGGALLTKSPALYFSLLLPTLVIVTGKKENILKYLVLLIPTYLIGYGMYNILRLGPNFNMLSSRNMDYVYPLSHIITSPLDPFKPFIDRSREFYWMMGTGSLFLLFVVGLLEGFRNKFKETLVLFGWFIGPILVSSEFSKTMTARYVLFSLPFFVMISAMAVFSKIKIVRNLSYFLFAGFVLQSLLLNYNLLFNLEKANLPRSERSGYLEEWTAGQGITEIKEYLINRQKGENKTVVVGTEGFFGTLPDGLQIYFDKNQNVNVIGIGLQLDKVPDQLVSAKKAGNLVFLVANDERMNADFKKLKLKLISSYPKMARPNGTKQSLVLYEVTDETISNKK